MTTTPAPASPAIATTASQPAALALVLGRRRHLVFGLMSHAP